MSVLYAASRLVKSGSNATALYRGTTKVWPVVDPDALDYINRVQAADLAAGNTQGGLEEGVKNAINDFVIGCKKDGIWGKIATSAIFCGARKIAGALQKLTGTTNPAVSMTSYGFIDNDYSRNLGILGTNTASDSKYIDTGFDVSYSAYPGWPTNSVHAAAYVGTAANGVIMASASSTPGIAEICIRPFHATTSASRARDSSGQYVESRTLGAGFVMVDRQGNSGSYFSQEGGQTTPRSASIANYSTTIPNNTVWLFRRNTGGTLTTAAQFAGRILYFSLGRSILLTSPPTYTMTGTTLSALRVYDNSGEEGLDAIEFNGRYITSGASLILEGPTPNIVSNPTITLEPYDPVLNEKRYVIRGEMFGGSNLGHSSRIAYVSMHREPSTSSGTISPEGYYQRVTVGNTFNPTAVTTECPYLQNDQQLLTDKYQARVNALIAGIQGSIV
jgi:hypothetical protein